jgi:chaperonin GroES
MAADINVLNFEQTNLALGDLEPGELKDLGSTAYRDYDIDQSSRIDWLEKTRAWLSKAAQYMQTKNFPWPGSSNIKYPLLTTAALQFHARAHQNLLKGNRIVKAKVAGEDPKGEKAGRGDRVSKFMSGQLLHAMKEWSDDTDQLLFLLPLIGTMFRKVYWSPSLGRAISELVLPQDLVVNYDAPDMQRARKSHLLFKTRNEVLEKIRAGEWADVMSLLSTKPTYLPDYHRMPNKKVDDETLGLRDMMQTDEQTPYTFVEQHTWFDLDDDGYQEPYIITFEVNSKAVVSVQPRWDVDAGIVTSEAADEPEVVRIAPKEYFIAYRFLPSFESKVYGLGLGHLLGPTNEAVDTIINQVIDSGTLANMPSGWLGRGARVSRGGRVRFRPGEWKRFDTATEDLRKQIVPLPLKEPSTVMFQLLGLLINAGEKIGSVTDAMQGELPGQNTAFSVVQSTIEQGMMVFNGIYKRIWRSMASEFQMLYALYGEHLDPEFYNRYLDTAEDEDPAQDFAEDDWDVFPMGDPDLVQDTLMMKKTEQIVALAGQGIPFNASAVRQMVVQSMQLPDKEIEQLLMESPPEPDLELQFKQQQHADLMRMKESELRIDAASKQYEGFKDYAQAIKALTEAAVAGEGPALEQAKLELEDLKQYRDLLMRSTELAVGTLDNSANRGAEDERHRETLSAQRGTGGQGEAGAGA